MKVIFSLPRKPPESLTLSYLRTTSYFFLDPKLNISEEVDKDGVEFVE